jgi:hypothetical protein
MFMFVSINLNAWLIIFCAPFFYGSYNYLAPFQGSAWSPIWALKERFFIRSLPPPRPPSHDREDAKYSTKNYTVLDRSSKIALRSGSRRVCVDLQDWREWPNTVHKRQKQRFWWRNERLCYLLKPVHAPYPFRPCFLRILST